MLHDPTPSPQNSPYVLVLYSVQSSLAPQGPVRGACSRLVDEETEAQAFFWLTHPHC